MCFRKRPGPGDQRSIERPADEVRPELTLRGGAVPEAQAGERLLSEALLSPEFLTKLGIRRFAKIVQVITVGGVLKRFVCDAFGLDAGAIVLAERLHQISQPGRIGVQRSEVDHELALVVGNSVQAEARRRAGMKIRGPFISQAVDPSRLRITIAHRLNQIVKPIGPAHLVFARHLKRESHAGRALEAGAQNLMLVEYLL